jgi:hypothetical protein
MAEAGDLWGLTVYFNPGGSDRRLGHLQRFAEHVRAQGLKLLIVELAFGDGAHVLAPPVCDKLIQVRARSVLWQKERLLNIGLRQLDRACTKIAWLDCDIIFENDDWVAQTSWLLENYTVVQPFQLVCLLRRGETSPSDDMSHGPREGQWMHSMAYVMSKTADRSAALRSYKTHGHCGLAWAARRDLLDRHGFYDRRVDGGNDLAMAHAMFANTGTWRESHWERDLLSPALGDDIIRWGSAFGADVGQRVGYVEGRLLHLWHGDYEDRQYRRRAGWLGAHAFDPAVDIAEDDSGCWAWASDKPELHREVHDFFVGQGKGA